MYPLVINYLSDASRRGKALTHVQTAPLLFHSPFLKVKITFKYFKSRECTNLSLASRGLYFPYNVSSSSPPHFTKNCSSYKLYIESSTADLICLFNIQSSGSQAILKVYKPKQSQKLFSMC